MSRLSCVIRTTGMNGFTRKRFRLPLAIAARENDCLWHWGIQRALHSPIDTHALSQQNSASVKSHDIWGVAKR